MQERSRKVLSFDGVDDIVSIGVRPEHKIARHLTMEAWVSIHKRKKYAGIVSRVFDTDSSESGYGLLLDGTDGIYGVFRTPDSKGSDFYQSSHPCTVPLDEWHHVAVTYDGKLITFYLDGEQKKAVPYSGDVVFTPDHALTLGAFKDNDEAYHFCGKIAEVRIWSSTRTPEQIAKTMNAPPRGDEADLAGYWPMDEGSGVMVRDRTRNGAAGTITGATWDEAGRSFGPTAEEEEEKEKEREAKEKKEKEEKEAKERGSALEALAKRVSELEGKIARCGDCEEKIAAQKQTIDALLERVKRLEVAAPSPKLPEPPRVWPPPGSPARMVISYIHFLGAEKGTQGDEHIEITNTGGTAQDIGGWRVRAGNAGQELTFPAGTVCEPGAMLRVYTNRDPDGRSSFSFGSKRPLWNDAGDTGQLRDASGALVAEYGYGTKETRTVESIKATYGIGEMRVVADSALIGKQTRKSDKVDFLTALERAVRSLLNDPATQDTPNAANQVRDNFDGVPRDADAETIRRAIRDHMNKNELRLLAEDSVEKSDLDAGTKDHWIFLLHRGMGDLHWVIVDRSGARPTCQQIT